MADRRKYLLSQYGISVDDYNQMYEFQNGRCAICGTWYEKLSVDHDHRTGKVRKLLCGTCNTGLGLFKDNPKILKMAATYIDDCRMESDVRILLRVSGNSSEDKTSIVNSDWRSLREQFPNEMIELISESEPKEIVKELLDLGIQVSSRTASNWKFYAQQEMINRGLK